MPLYGTTAILTPKSNDTELKNFPNSLLSFRKLKNIFLTVNLVDVEVASIKHPRYGTGCI